MRTKQGRDLIHRISIEEQTEAKDSIGGSTMEWIEFKKAYASVKPLSGREFMAGQAHQNAVTHRVIIRFVVGVLPKMRVLHKDRVFNIKAVRDFGEREIWLELMCEELL